MQSLLLNCSRSYITDLHNNNNVSVVEWTAKEGEICRIAPKFSWTQEKNDTQVWGE